MAATASPSAGTTLTHSLTCGCQLLRPCRLCGILVFVEYAAESVLPTDVELVESVWFGKRFGGRPEGSGAQGAVVPVLVVEGRGQGVVLCNGYRENSRRMPSDSRRMTIRPLRVSQRSLMRKYRSSVRCSRRRPVYRCRYAESL